MLSYQKIVSLVIYLGLVVTVLAEDLYCLEESTDYYYPQARLSAKVISVLACAAYSWMHRIKFFSFQDGVCKIYESFNATFAAGHSQRYMFYKPIDRARGKPTLPDKGFAIHHPYRVVDGDLNTQYHSIGKIDPWWSVDLEHLYLIRTIDVLPHPHVPTWFTEIKVFVGNTSSPTGDFTMYNEVAYFEGPWDGYERVVFTPPPFTIGRYVAIKGTSGKHFLNLVDVLIIA